MKEDADKKADDEKNAKKVEKTMEDVKKTIEKK